MTVLECVRMMRKLICGLILWNLLLTGFIVYHISSENDKALNQQICNEEMIPADLGELEVINE